MPINTASDDQLSPGMLVGFHSWKEQTDENYSNN